MCTIEGNNANVRYKRVTEGCVFTAAVPCVDVIEALKIEAKTHNDYCVSVEDIGIGLPSRACFGLQMRSARTRSQRPTSTS